MNTSTPDTDDRLATTPAVEIVIPVYNEERALAASVRKLHRYMKREFTFAFRITIADNASVDRTLAIAQALAAELADVDVLHLDRKGRGRALRAAWTRSDADVVAHMDVDLSTELPRCRACSCRCCNSAPTSRSARASLPAPTSHAGSSAS